MHGYLTIELTNHGPDALSLHWGMPIAGSCFVSHRLEQPSPAAKASGGGPLAELPEARRTSRWRRPGN